MNKNRWTQIKCCVISCVSVKSGISGCCMNAPRLPELWLLYDVTYDGLSSEWFSTESDI